MRTMGVINPLLVGETIEHVAELDRMLQLLALKILVNYRNVDPSFDETTYIPSSLHLKEVIRTAFRDWDVRGVSPLFTQVDTNTFALNSLLHNTGRLLHRGDVL